MAKKIDQPFIRVHELLPQFPEIEALSDRAFRDLFRAMCASRDGFVEIETISPKSRDEMIAQGVMSQDGLLFVHGDLFDGPYRGQTLRPPIPIELRRAVYERDGFHCVQCGADRPLSLDHIYPWSLGGEDTFDNLQTLCLPCNSRKGARA